jgi:SAM-dependent methyltransferase
VATEERAEHLSTQERFPQFLPDQREFFDRLVTDDWETYDNPAWDGQRRREVAAILSRVPARRVLDVGCGCGFHDVEIAEWPGVEEVVGIDYSPRSVEVAEREYPHPRVRRAVADIFELQPEDDSFDLVASFQVIEHLTDPFRFLESCLRHLRPGGALAIVTPNRLRLDNRLRSAFGKELRLVDPQHFQEYTPRELRDLAAPLPLEPAATVGLTAALTVPRVHVQAVPPRLGRALAALAPPVSSSFAQVWRRRV